MKDANDSIGLDRLHRARAWSRDVVAAAALTALATALIAAAWLGGASGHRDAMGPQVQVKAD